MATNSANNTTTTAVNAGGGGAVNATATVNTNASASSGGMVTEADRTVWKAPNVPYFVNVAQSTSNSEASDLLSTVDAIMSFAISKLTNGYKPQVQ